MGSTNSLTGPYNSSDKPPIDFTPSKKSSVLPIPKCEINEVPLAIEKGRIGRFIEKNQKWIGIALIVVAIATLALAIPTMILGGGVGIGVGLGLILGAGVLFTIGGQIISSISKESQTVSLFSSPKEPKSESKETTKAVVESLKSNTACRTAAEPETSKNQAIQDYDSNEFERHHAFMEKIERDFNRIDVRADGNCLFHSLTYLFKHLEKEKCSNHTKIRKNITHFMELNKDHYKHFVKDFKIDAHIKKMKKVGEWGDEKEVNAFANYMNQLGHKIVIIVHDPSKHVDEIRYPAEGVSKDAQEFHLLRINENHWQPLRFNVA